ncbi:class 1 isoprenoid biosynthesis enzyme [Paenibacillus wynnii]|uniref:Terpene synthase n=1 Tax=Paenibacillus wynnii TaxID=268407 RepID=A0A098MCE7_9BACL|nr:class 1 isoprenoid biosynthesis enzyme [Paenibacillus wynnii]KGE19227.1 hypothetical protein PWYN_07580 [Paenibacillus wynnii]
MNWLHDYEEELRIVFHDCRHIISQFPDPLNAYGLSYLHHFNVFETESHKNYICYLLPFWFQENGRLTAQDCRQMSIGNVFLMLYFFIQDDLMDTSTTSAFSTLPLANLLYIEFLNIYRSYFPGKSPFWTYFNRYISEWAESVSNENREDYFRVEQVKVAYKASPLKLSSTAALLLSDQDTLIPQSEEMLHYVLLTLQMLDDYEDWKEDLEEGSYNCLLSLTRQELNCDKDSLTQADVKEFIYTNRGLERFTQIAWDHHNRLLGYSLKVPNLLDFHHRLTNNLMQISAAIETEKKLLQSGGLHYWLSKNM